MYLVLTRYMIGLSSPEDIVFRAFINLYDFILRKLSILRKEMSVKIGAEIIELGVVNWTIII